MMEAIDDIQLPPMIQTENLECTAHPEKPELSCTNDLPEINTDDLPITPLRNKRWLNNVAQSPDLTKGTFSLNLTSLAKSPSLVTKNSQEDLNLNSSYNELNRISLPNTDNLLDINVPKTVLLGKEQAKKRLHAFSLAKQNNLNVSPLSKKKSLRQPKFLLQPSEDKYNENGEKTEEKFVLVKKPPKKNANPNEKAKAVIEEIEEIKKIESAYLEALEQGLLDRNRRSRTKSRSRERNKRRNRKEHKIKKRSRSVENSKSRKSWEKFKYPTSWAEFKIKGYDFKTLVSMKSKDYKSKDDECSDFRKQLLFQTPSLPLHRLSVKTINGKEKNIPAEYVRITNRTPRISYSVKEKLSNDCYLRKSVLQYVPKSFRDVIKKIADSSTPIIISESPTKSTARKWFTKSVLSKLEYNTECKILETSLGLSFLQTYSDEDEQEKETSEKEREEIDLIRSKSDLEEDITGREKLNKAEAREESPEKIKYASCENFESKIEVDSEAEVAENQKKTKKHKRKEKDKHKLKPKKEKLKKKSKNEEDKHEKMKKRKSSGTDDDSKRHSDKHKEGDNRKVDNSHKMKTEIDETKQITRRSQSIDIKDRKTRSSSKEEKYNKTRKNDHRNPVIKEQKKSESDSNKPDNDHSDNFNKRESRKGKEDQSKERQDHTKKNKLQEKQQTRSRSKEKMSKKRNKSSSPSNREQEVRKVKCVAEKEFGTPDTEEYYSNWESDEELVTNMEKPHSELLNQSVNTSRSWQSDEEPLEVSDITISDVPLVKSPFRTDKSPLSAQLQNKDKLMLEQSALRKTYKREREKSLERSRGSERRSILRDKSRHLESFPLDILPIQNELSPIPKHFSPLHLSPVTNNEFSPFRNRCIDDRRRSRRSMERSPEQFLEMPLNIRNTRKSYSRNKWDEERFDNKYGSPTHAEFGLRMHEENKIYALYAENPWERDDYLTIKTEEMRLEEERRTLIEERRKLEIERQKFEELERQRYYSRMSEIEQEERRQEQFKISDDDEKRYRSHRDYRESRDHQNDIAASRRTIEDQRSRRRYSSERSAESRERPRDNFNWEDSVDSKRNEKYAEKPQEQESIKRRRKSRWQNIDDCEPLHENEQCKKVEGQEGSRGTNEYKSYSKERKIPRKNRWESSEDEIINISRDQNKQEEQLTKVKGVASREKRDREQSPGSKRRTNKKDEESREKSLTDNLQLPTQKSFAPKTSVDAGAHKPEALENEYEKFMQALGSEISTAEEISEKDFKQKKHRFSSKSKLTDKRVKQRKSFPRAVSVSSDEEYEKSSKREARKRKVKKKVSSSSSSSTSSSSSDSNTSSESSSISSSSDFSSGNEKRWKMKQRISIGVAKVKVEGSEAHQQEKNAESKLKCTQLDISNFDVMSASCMTEKKSKEVIKIEDTKADMVPDAQNKLLNQKKPTTNLNIINLTIPEFSLGEIPLPNCQVANPSVKTSSSEIPLPVPSPKVSLITSVSVLNTVDAAIPKTELVMPPLPNADQCKSEINIAATETASVLPTITPLTPSKLTRVDSEMTHLNAVDVKETPMTPEENKLLLNDVTVSPTKRNNLIPIKFLTAEVRKQANESPNFKALGTIETKESLSSTQVLTELKTNATIDKNDFIETLPLTNRKRHFAMSSINLPAKRPLLEGPEHEENSADFTDRFIRRDEKEESVIEVSITEQLKRNQTVRQREKSFERERERQIKVGRDRSKERQKRRSMSPRRKRDSSPRRSRRNSRSPYRYESKRRCKDVSPRRKERDMSPRTQRGWDYNGSPRRTSRDTSVRRYRDESFRRNSSISPGRKEFRRRSVSPRDSGTKKLTSPRRRSSSPKRRSISREFSPKRHRSKDRDRDRSSSKDRKLESIQETLQRIAGVDKYSNILKRSPISSPLHGFKRSVADSTISDDQLLQRNTEQYAESPSFTSEYFKIAVSDCQSPKRMSLDERISQALGLAEQQAKPISTTYSENFEYDPQYFEQFGQYYEQYNEQNRKSSEYGQVGGYRQSRQRENSNLKVVQVGNVLQVVPTEDVTQKQPPLQQNQVTNSTQKIVQVGNMLQIVPTATLPEAPIVPMPSVPLPQSVPSTPAPPVTLSKDTLNAEALIKQKTERRAEKDKRRQERERKRKEKEKKRKEREKRKQLKVKLQTEAMIKQALIRETEETVVIGNEDDRNLENASDAQAPVQWPPVPQIVCNSSYKPAGKGILCHVVRSSSSKDEESEKVHVERRKCVKFSDGVAPGEGTSPSGGEELSSPPPAPRKLPKEKRFVKTKIPKKVKVPKKKKVKVKVIRQQQTQGTEDDEEDEDDNLPPPPPPPGSPPPHIFPARIKLPLINNIHPNVVVSIANPPSQATDTSYPPPPVYRTGIPPVTMSHHHGHQHHGPPHMPPFAPPHGGHHHHPPPCPPPHHGGFNPPTVVIPPVMTVVPSLPSVIHPPHHHHHHGGHHHHHSPHHGHHHH